MPQVKDKLKPALDPLVAALAERVRVLERAMAAITAGHSEPSPRDYFNTSGTMPDDEATRDAERRGRAWRRRQGKC